MVEAGLGHTVRRDSRVQAEVANLNHDSQNLLSVVVASIHNIAPNVILAKREVRNVVGGNSAVAITRLDYLRE